MKKQTWVLVANSSNAKIFQAQDNQILVEIQAFDHPESRLHDTDLVSSKQGRTFSRMGTMRSSLEYKTDPKAHEFIVFARELSQFLDEAREEGKFNKLYLAAGPTFLGILRQELSSLTDHIVAGEVDHDLT